MRRNESTWASALRTPLLRLPSMGGHLVERSAFRALAYCTRACFQAMKGLLIWAVMFSPVDLGAWRHSGADEFWRSHIGGVGVELLLGDRSSC